MGDLATSLNQKNVHLMMDSMLTVTKMIPMPRLVENGMLKKILYLPYLHLHLKLAFAPYGDSPLDFFFMNPFYKLSSTKLNVITRNVFHLQLRKHKNGMISWLMKCIYLLLCRS